MYTQGKTGVDFGKLGGKSAGEVELVDYRLLGCSLKMAVAYHDKISSLVDAPHLAGQRVERTVLDGRPALLITSKHVSGRIAYRVWVRPDDGHNIVRAESVADATDGNPAGTATLVVGLKKYGAEGIIYPASVSLTHTSGGVKNREEKIDVVSAAFNAEVSPTAFSLEAIAPAEGTNIYLPEIRNAADAPKWRAGKLDYGEKAGDLTRKQDAERPPPAVPAVPETRPRPVFLVAAGVAAFLGLVLLWRFRRRK